MMRGTDEIVAVAEELLSKRFGGTQSLTDIEKLGGSGTAIVLRARVAPSPFLQQRSVVLKYTPATNDSMLDLPTPSGPISPTMQPAGRSSVTPSSASVLR